VAVQLIGLNAWAWQTQQQLADMRSSMGSVLKSTYPHIQVVIDAPLQMERELSAQLQASGAPSSRDLETLLGAFVALAPTPQALSAIEFEANELKLHGVSLTAEQIQSLDMGLKARGLAAKLDGAALVIHQKSRP
jgi:general secretion pathway protein L